MFRSSVITVSTSEFNSWGQDLGNSNRVVLEFQAPGLKEGQVDRRSHSQLKLREFVQGARSSHRGAPGKRHLE